MSAGTSCLSRFDEVGIWDLVWRQNISCVSEVSVGVFGQSRRESCGSLLDSAVF